MYVCKASRIRCTFRMTGCLSEKSSIYQPSLSSNKPSHPLQPPVYSTLPSTHSPDPPIQLIFHGQPDPPAKLTLPSIRPSTKLFIHSAFPFIRFLCSIDPSIVPTHRPFISTDFLRRPGLPVYPSMFIQQFCLPNQPVHPFDHSVHPIIPSNRPIQLQDHHFI